VGPAIREGWGGSIHDGRYLPTGRRVTVEEIRPDLALRAGLIDRLAEVGRDAASLRDPHLLAVYDLVDAGTGYRLVAEWSDAPTLAQRLRGGAVSPQQAVAIITDILAGLGILHDAGVFHGQVGLDTVVVESDGRARLAELAVCAAAAPPGAGPADDVREAARLGLHLTRRAGSRLDPVRRRLEVALASGTGDAAGLRAELDAAAAAALGAGWRDRLSAGTLPARAGGHRRRGLIVVAVLALLAVAAGVTAGVVLLLNRPAGVQSSGPLVIGSDATVTVSPATGGCNTTFVFVGRGSLSGAGTLIYRWEQSDGEVTADTSLPIRATEGAFQLTEAWRLQGSQTVNGGMILHILKPVDRSIRQTFRYVCR
jgi:hypothetical protein